MRYLLYILFIYVFIDQISVDGAPSKKKQKYFSLLNIVRFANQKCTTQSSTPLASRHGTCFTRDECNNNGGLIDGNCASGFGVCCVLTLKSCGGTITQNCTYVQNPEFPSGFTLGGNTMCSYTVPRNMDGICSIRLDFETFSIRQPVQGNCLNENFMATSPTGLVLPVLCGTLTGSHMYISSGTVSQTAASFKINFDPASNAVRSWDIKVTMIPCNSMTLPPDGCLQYYTGTTAKIQNFNFGALLQSQAYNICLRQEAGFCTVSYSVDESSQMPDPFNLDLGATSKVNPGECLNAQIVIPSTVNKNAGNFHCGNFLNTVTGSVVNSAVIGDTPPFNVRVTTEAVNLMNTGFRLCYSMIPC